MHSEYPNYFYRLRRVISILDIAYTSYTPLSDILYHISNYKQTMSEGEEPASTRHRGGGCKAGDNCKGIACSHCWSFKVSSKSITLKPKPKAMSVTDDDVPIDHNDDVALSNSDVAVASVPDENKKTSGISALDNNTKGTSNRVLSKTHLFNSLSVSEEMKPIMLSLSTPEQVEKFRMETGLYQEEEGEEEDTPMNVDDTSTTNKKSKKKWWKKNKGTKSKIKAATDNGKIYESSNSNKRPLYTALTEFYDNDSDESKRSSKKKEEQIVVEEDLDELKPDIDADTNGEEKKVEEEVRNNKDSSSLTSLKEYVVRESNTKDDTFCTSVAMALESGVEGGSSNIEDLLPPVNVHKEKIDVSSPPVKVSKTKWPKTKRTRENLSYMSLDDHYDNISDDLSDNAVPPPLPEIFVSESRGVADEPTKLQDKEIKKEIEEVDITICEDDFLDHLIESIMEVKEKNIDYITGCDDNVNKDALTESVPEVVRTCLVPRKEDKINSSVDSPQTASDRTNKKINNVLSRSKLIGNVNTGPSKKNSIKPFNSLNEGEAEAVEMIINDTAVSTPPSSQSQSKPQKKTRLAMARGKITRSKETVSKQEQVLPPDVLKSITIIPAASTVLEQQEDIQAEDELSVCPSQVPDTSKQLKRERLRAIMDKRKSGRVLNENKKPEEKRSPTELTEFKKLLTSKRLFNPSKGKAEKGQGFGAAFGGDNYVETPEDRIKAALRLPADTSKDSNDEENVAPQAPIYPLNQVDVNPEEDNVVVSKLTTPTKDEGNGEKKKTSPLDSCGMMGIEIANDLKEAIIMPAKNLCTSEGIYPRWCFSDNADEQVVQEGDRQEVLVMWQPTNEDTDRNQESNEPSAKPPTLAEKTLNSIFPKEESQVRSPSPTLTDISSESSEDVNPEVKKTISEALEKARLQKHKKDTKSAAEAGV